MRLSLFALVLIAFISCKNNSDQKTAETTAKPTDSTAVKDAWIADFKKFRDALYRNDTSVMKSYFRFPIQGYEIWQLVFWNQEFVPEPKFVESKKGFSKQDFQTYKAEIFPKEFITSLLEVNTDSLHFNSTYETKLLRKNDSFSYSMVAIVENNNTILKLSYNYQIEHRDKKGEISELGGARIIYLFEIIDRKKIKYLGLEFAG